MATLLRLEIDYFISRAEEERKRRNRILSVVEAALVVLAWHEIEAFRVLREAEAQSNLGCLYFVTKDYVKATESFEKAAANGSVEAKFFLGAMYDEDLGMEQDYEKARKWYEKAVAQGNATAQRNLDRLRQKYPPTKQPINPHP